MASSAWVALTVPLAGPKQAGLGETASSAAIYSYLDRLPGAPLARLYASPSSALAIFRLLPMLARHIVMNLLWIDTILLKDLESWFSRRSEGKRQMELALQALRRLHVLDDTPAADESFQTVALNKNFQKSVKRALTGGGSHNSFGVPIDPSTQSQTVDIDFLDDYANASWETILHFLVGSTWTSKPTDAVLDMLKHSGLMSGSAARNLKITSKGFQFLLEDVNTQLWDILLRYLHSAEAKDMDIVEVLALLFMLGSLELGRAYSVRNLSDSQVTMLKDLRDYGLIYTPSDHVQASLDDFFYPTRLATTLTSNAPPLVTKVDGAPSAPSINGSAASVQEQGFIVLETNYRVYAYTSNPLQIAVLDLFLALRSRFPNLVMGMITRESIKSALSNGITAQQIITYLTVHAHPQMRKQTPLLPPTVVDQIRLWELEKNRINDDEGYLYEDFRTQADYDLVINYAKQLGVVLWEGAANTRKFFVTMEGHITIRDFIKRRMAAAQAAQGVPSAA
ncbi:RNA polymerase II transcription factor B 52 kDa subunit [Cystobasidiomycetes sp. EMM_F5]